jgi:hypothetical protein
MMTHDQDKKLRESLAQKFVGKLQPQDLTLYGRIALEYILK